MIDKRTVTAAEAFRKSLLSSGKKLVSEKLLKGEAKELGIRRRKYKYASIDKALLCSVLSKRMGDLCVSDGCFALGPMPLDDKIAKHLVDKTILPWGDPASLSLACPPLLRMIEDGTEGFESWKTSFKSNVSNGDKPYQNYVTLSNGALVNIIYFIAAARHVDATKPIEKMEAYQDPKDILSPVIFMGSGGNYAVSMPIRGE